MNYMKFTLSLFLLFFACVQSFGQTAKTPKYIFNNITFESWKTEITTEGTLELQRLIDLLKKNENLKAEFIGHTDNIGTPEANQKLSEERAKQVYDWVIKKGIPQNRVSYSGKGLTKPVSGNDTAEGRKRNRRVEIVVIESQNLTGQ